MKLQQASIEIVRQLIEVSDQLSQEEYIRPLDILLNHSVGKHIRHIIEFYYLLFSGHDSGMVNYDRREHDKELESNKVLATMKMHTLLGQLFESSQDKPLVLSAAYAVKDQEPVIIQTTFYRELLYNIEHTIHHMAILKMAILHKFPHIIIPEQFGVAYSTIRHQEQAVKCRN